MVFYQIQEESFFVVGIYFLEKNLEVSAKNVEFLLYLEFKYLGGSCVGEEFEVESERLNKTKKSILVYSGGARLRNSIATVNFGKLSVPPRDYNSSQVFLTPGLNHP